MRAEINVPDGLGAFALDAALEGLVQLATVDLADGGVEGEPAPRLYDSGVRYERERGSERWLVPSQVLELGVGDCEDLAAWRAAELRVSGEDPAALARVVRAGPRTWHAIVERGDGTIEDPSRLLGMGSAEVGSLADWRIIVEPAQGGAWVARIGRGDSFVAGVAMAGDDALVHACDVAGAVGELGIFPGLDLIAKAAQGALSAVLPGAQGAARPRTPAGRATAAPRAVTRPAAPAVPPATAAPDLGDEVERIAAQLARLTQREVKRKVVQADRAAARARARVVR